MGGKPTAQELSGRLGVRLDDLPWRTSGRGEGMFQVAITCIDDTTWVLVRLQGQSNDAQVYSEHEWSCFLEGARRGEFDDLL